MMQLFEGLTVTEGSVFQVVTHMADELMKVTGQRPEFLSIGTFLKLLGCPHHLVSLIAGDLQEKKAEAIHFYCLILDVSHCNLCSILLVLWDSSLQCGKELHKNTNIGR